MRSPSTYLYKLISKIVLTLCFITGVSNSFAQQVSFSNISTVNGLSDNFIRSIVIDKKGFLWVGTNEGLNSYDGYLVTQYSRDEHPQIPSKMITSLFCDSKDNIWLGSNDGVAWADKKRLFHKVSLTNSSSYRCEFITETSKYGVVLVTDKGQFYSDSKGVWKQIDWIPSFLDYNKTVDVIKFDSDRSIVSTDSVVLLINYTSGQVEYQQAFKNVLSVCTVSNNEIAVANNAGQLFVVNVRNKNIIRQFDFSQYSNPRITSSPWVEVRPAANGSLLYASMNHGFFVVGKNGKVSHFVHDPVNPFSIAANKVTRVLGSANGTVVVGTERYGLSIFNILKTQAGYQKVFTDAKGNVFDGFITEMIQDSDGSFWLGAADRLIHWNKEQSTSQFFKYSVGGSPLSPEIYRLCLDKNNQLWVSIYGLGIAKFNKQSGKFGLIKRDTTDASQKSDVIFDLFPSSDGKIWVASASGYYWLNPATGKTERISIDALKPFSTVRTNGFAEDKQNRIWISTAGEGVICYDPSDKSIQRFRKKDGLLDDVCLDMFCSSKNDIYVSFFTGFNIIHANGKISTYTKANGLRFDKADAFIEDDANNVWISNAKCLVKLNPASNKLEIFDEHENLNNGGFKPTSALVAANGELIWGTQSGVNYFFPFTLDNKSIPFDLSIYKVTAGDSVIYTSNTSIPYKQNDLLFDFTAVDLTGSHNIRYQYILEGYDKQWQEGTDIRQARYSSLSPGDYTFKVRASSNQKDWIESSNQFSFSIIAPVYMRWWFKMLVGLAIAILLYYLFLRRSRLLKEKQEELETEQAINYISSSMYRYQTVDEILWDIAKNCIGRLRFEDCVIYLLDEKRNVLVQKAAYGPKSPKSFEIAKPLDIPVGKGIVGTVAENKKAEIIADTSKDSRYIADDAVRLSEITVPIMSGDKVLGIIDCEHSKKRFFTQKHLSILSTIASLCASKIVMARAEAAKKETEVMLAETRQKMAEAEMQALRAQMNPHFIFNCLNSINRYIVKSDQATASLYLTRFAKLIRLILDNSNHKNIILSHEVEALKLYIEMESLRFDNKFTYSVLIDKNVSADSIEVPPLIIQPYIENAIWHGLLHKESGGHLNVHLKMVGDSLLQCVIEDNGVGREKSAELKSKSATKKKSLGMELTQNRLLLLNQYASVHSGVEIEDMKDDKGSPLGTKVILKIPVGEN